MRSKEKVTPFVILTAVILLVALGVGIMLTAPPNDNKESVNEVMQNAVLHETDKIDLFGIMQVNPSVVSAYTVTAILLVFAALVRIFAIPRFKLIPGAFQSLIEKLVELFDNMAKSYSPYHNGFLGAYIFAAGCYVFFGTVFELFGIPAVNAHGLTVSLPAPLSDINGAAAMGIMSYSVILGAGIYFNGLLASAFDELPYVRSAPQRSACHRACVLHDIAQLCRAGYSRCSVHSASCDSTDLRPYNAYLHLLR